MDRLDWLFNPLLATFLEDSAIAETGGLTEPRQAREPGTWRSGNRAVREWSDQGLDDRLSEEVEAASVRLDGRRLMNFVDITLRDRFCCSLSRAFAAPILGDATRYLDGYRLQPAIVAFEDDSTWGQPNGVRYPVTMGNWLIPPGRLLTDVILKRVENASWEWQIADFRAKSLFFISHAVGRWTVSETGDGRVEILYSYRYFASHWLYVPLLRCFASLQLRGMLRRALAGIKEYAEGDKPMLYH